MIRQLRKKHFQAWLALAVLMPAGIVTAWLSVKQPVHDAALQPETSEGFPNIISSVERNDFTVRLRSRGSHPQQLEWINKTILTIPSAIIYETVAGSTQIES